MSYIVSARKWRPQTFDEIVGQKHIVKTLKNAISNRRIANAYIFSGTRGVGKTTTARILSKALNCTNGPTADPCGNCKSCREVKQGSSLDVIEIDGASNRGIDDIRNLRENVRYAPAHGKYKIYIIDEVHMLTKEAFNALLKTLEEPPEHVLFVFATTEINKVPDTILSRCQWFDFKSLNMDDITCQLRFIAKSDSTLMNDECLKLISKNAQGSMRDAQMLFDQVVSFCGEEIKEEDVRNVLGLVDRSLVKSLFDCIIHKDLSGVLDTVKTLKESGCDIKVFHKEVVGYLRNLMVLKLVPDKGDNIISISPAEKNDLKEQSDQLTMDQIYRIFNILFQLDRDIKLSSYPEVVLEMNLLKLAKLEPLIPVDSVLEKIDNVKKLVSQKEILSQPIHRVMDGPIKADKIKPEIPVLPTPKVEVKAKVVDAANFEKAEESVTPQKEAKRSSSSAWEKIIGMVGQTKPLLGSVLTNAKLLEMESQISIAFSEQKSIYIDMLKEKGNLNCVMDVAEAVLGKRLQVVVKKVKGENLEKTRNQGKKSEESDQLYASEREIISEALNIFNGNII